MALPRLAAKLALPLPSLRRRQAVSGFAVLLAQLPLHTAAAPPTLRLPPLEEGKRRLYLARHGETEWNVRGLIQGRTDNELNERGRAQAAALAALLAPTPLGIVASSPLRRAAETAAIVARDHPAARRVEEARLAEMDFGVLEGTAPPGNAAYAAVTAAWGRGETGARWEGGESADEVAARGLAGLRALGALGPRGVARHTLVVAHGRFNKIVIAALRGDVAKCNEIPQGNTCLNVIDVDEEGNVEVVAVNIQDHLKLLAVPA
ncbi:hypothetical protein AB1Y20_008215 [Prymnesium parvum]|uniref:Phosphoglycerate mutase (2,3-diphosphoglycerate-dependent) n=1 Tax=Prymnesium parvum TaxID=97485 RepID=A0AB34IVY1_PRYPA